MSKCEHQDKSQLPKRLRKRWSDQSGMIRRLRNGNPRCYQLHYGRLILVPLAMNDMATSQLSVERSSTELQRVKLGPKEGI